MSWGFLIAVGTDADNELHGAGSSLSGLFASMSGSKNEFVSDMTAWSNISG